MSCSLIFAAFEVISQLLNLVAHGFRPESNVSVLIQIFVPQNACTWIFVDTKFEAIQCFLCRFDVTIQKIDHSVRFQWMVFRGVTHVHVSNNHHGGHVTSTDILLGGVVSELIDEVQETLNTFLELYDFLYFQVLSPGFPLFINRKRQSK